VSSPYDLLADDALFEVFKVLYQLPDEIASADVDAQADMVERYLELKDLQDPEKVSKMIVKFSVLYDLENQSTTDPALSVLTSSGSAGISADLMMSLAQLRTGG
ncbi:MAG: flagellar protein, partial [Stutzerimonas stutzeri]